MSSVDSCIKIEILELRLSLKEHEYTHNYNNLLHWYIFALIFERGDKEHELYMLDDGSIYIVLIIMIYVSFGLEGRTKV